MNVVHGKDYSTSLYLLLEKSLKMHIEKHRSFTNVLRGCHTQNALGSLQFTGKKRGKVIVQYARLCKDIGSFLYMSPKLHF